MFYDIYVIFSLSNHIIIAFNNDFVRNFAFFLKKALLINKNSLILRQIMRLQRASDFFETNEA